ncbi:MAG: PA3496 family putative envelope integrity protein [Methylococcaceae bacterium]
MTKTPQKSAPKSGSQNTPEIENDDDDVFEGGEYISLADGLEEETIKRDARRKIEIYWEKKRLKEQFDDFDESEFGF